VRCPRCGNENSEENRFCGMCGGTLLPPPAPVGSAPAQAVPRSSTISSPASSVLQSPSTSTRPLIPAAPRTAAPVSEDVPRNLPRDVSQDVSQDVPHISGPSFLGLSEPGPRKRGNLSIDPQSAPSSRNLDYLLEDDEGHKGGGTGKFILILLALALAVGLGYLRWKNHGFPSLGSIASKPSAATQNSDSPDASSTTSPASSASPAPAPSQPAGAPASSSDTPTAAGAGATTAPAPTTTNSATDPATGTAPSTPPATSPAASTGAPPSTSAPAAAASSSGAVNSQPDADSAAPAATTAAAPDSPSPTRSPAPAPTNPKTTAAIDRPAKPHAATQLVKPLDRVAEAQKYIYGRGVTQDCERGMRILKPAADQANPSAMIEMGALYSAGLCTPHDLPTAYRWFALALRKDPDNMAVQTDLQKLWGEMTQPERQLAIKMSQ